MKALQDAMQHPSIALLLFLTYLFLLHPIILVNLSDINPFDEAVYLNAGRILLEGSLPRFAANPLVSVFNAITYFPFNQSPYWMVESAIVGRLLLLSLVWLSVYLIARQLHRLAAPMIMLGFLLVTPLVTEFIRFPSDPLFASLAALAFWQLLSFHNRLKTKHLWWASLFMGLAALARNDGLLLWLIFLALVVLTSVGRRRISSTILPSILPFIGIVGGYMLIYGATTGSFELGTIRRTYDNFEAGQQVIYGGEGKLNPVIESKLEAREIFGTARENNFSVISAIRRNPAVYMTRVTVMARSLPERVLNAYGQRFTALFILLGIRGVIELIRRKEYRLLAIFLAWPLYALSGFVITIFRQGHLQFHYYIIFGLAAIGLAGLLANLSNRRERYLWYGLLAGLAVYGLAFGKLAIYLGVIVFLFTLWLIHIISSQNQKFSGLQAVVYLVLLSAGFILHGNYPSPKIPSLGEDAREQAAVFMSETLPAETRVAAGAPGVVWMARMDYSGLASGDVPIDGSTDGLVAWLEGRGIGAIYVDHLLYNSNPAVWNLIKPGIGTQFERVFSADSGDIQVLILNPDR